MRISISLLSLFSLDICDSRLMAKLNVLDLVWIKFILIKNYKYCNLSFEKIIKQNVNREIKTDFVE